MPGRKASSTTEEREAPRDKNRQPGSERRDVEKHGPGTKMKTKNESIVSVTFNVTVPESSTKLRRSVFLTGTLNKINGKLVDWSPKAQQMKRVDDRHWTVTISGPAGTEIEYKYTLGDWEHVEQNEQCADTPNRRVTLRISSNDEPLNIDDTVQNWRGIQPCG